MPIYIVKMLSVIERVGDLLEAEGVAERADGELTSICFCFMWSF